MVTVWRGHVRMIKVVIADDSLSIRKGVRNILEHTQGISVVGEASNGREAIVLVEKLSPDVLILDFFMPVMNGIAAMITLRKRGCQIPILILSASDDCLSVTESLNNGAQGYILKDEAPELLVSTIQHAVQGEDRLNSLRVQKIYRSMMDMS